MFDAYKPLRPDPVEALGFVNPHLRVEVWGLECWGLGFGV